MLKLEHDFAPRIADAFVLAGRLMDSPLQQWARAGAAFFSVSTVVLETQGVFFPLQIVDVK